MSSFIRHELLDLPPHRTVPAVLDGVVRAPRQGLGDVGPARAAPRVAPQDDLVLGGRPGQLADVGVQLVVPPFPTLLARAARQVRREDGPLARAVALDRAQQELVLGGGPGALDLCCAWGVWGRLAASLVRVRNSNWRRAKKMPRPSPLAARARVWEFMVGCEAARGSVSCVSGGNSPRRR